MVELGGLVLVQAGSGRVPTHHHPPPSRLPCSTLGHGAVSFDRNRKGRRGRAHTGQGPLRHWGFLPAPRSNLAHISVCPPTSSGSRRAREGDTERVGHRSIAASSRLYCPSIRSCLLSENSLLSPAPQKPGWLAGWLTVCASSGLRHTDCATDKKRGY